MLGFSPLGSAPLADSGIILYSLTANGVATQAPSVPAVFVYEEETVSPVPIVAGSPTLGDVDFNLFFNLQDCTTGTPDVSDAILYLSFGRLITITQDSTNAVSLVESGNVVTLPTSTNQVVISTTYKRAV